MCGKHGVVKRRGRAAMATCCCLISLVFLRPHAAVGAGAFVRFFANQEVGQEITVTGGFRRFPNKGKRRYFFENAETGEVEYVEYYGMTIVPSLVVGKGSVSMKASLITKMLLFYADPELVEDIPLKGESYWFTGTLIGYQYGAMGITRGMGVGGDPYILLESISAEPPEGVPSPTPRRRPQSEQPDPQTGSK